MTHAHAQVEVRSEINATDETSAGAPEAAPAAPPRRDITAALFHQLRQYPAGHPSHTRIRDELVRLNMPLVTSLARRFQNRGEPLEDLEQVAVVGLLHAIDRFDVSRGVAFSTFATPTIAGEIKRYFRDHGWMVRVPRMLQEMRLQLTSTAPVLAQELGRSPTVAELAQRLNCEEADVVEGLAAGNAYSALSLDLPTGEDSDEPPLADGLGAEETAYDFIDDCVSLRPLLEGLPERERRILHLRFFEDMTQTEIAQQVGISQMHVSRLLSRTLSALREGLADAPAAGLAQASAA
jgi:RNA polymerase sigma-B factor